MRVLLSTLLISFLLAAQTIDNSIPPLSTQSLTFQLLPKELYRGQKYIHKFPLHNIGSYSSRIVNEQQLQEHQVQCKWSEPFYNFTNVAITKNITFKEGERIVTGGFIKQGSRYYVATNRNRIFKIQTEMSTRSLKIIEEIPLSQSIKASSEFLNYKEGLVLESNNTLIFVESGNVSYVAIPNTDPVVKILPVNDSIYILSGKKLQKWTPEGIENITIGQVENLVDMDVRADGKVYVLDSKRAIFTLSGGVWKENSFDVNEGMFSKIRVAEGIIQCIYTLKKSNFLIELYDFEDKISINKIYPITAHINNIIIFDYYTIILHDYHISLVLHSASRNIPDLEYSSLINSLLIPRVTSLSKLRGDMVLVIRQNEVFLSRSISVSPPSLTCEFEKAGIYNITLQYQLSHCQTTNSSPILNGYCTKTFQQTITVREAKKLRIVLFVYILAGVILVFIIGIIIGGIIYCSNVFKKHEDKLKLLEKKRSERVNDTVGDEKKRTITEFNVVNNVTNTINQTGLAEEHKFE